MNVHFKRGKIMQDGYMDVLKDDGDNEGRPPKKDKP